MSQFHPKSNNWVVVWTAWWWILVDSGRFSTKIARGLGVMSNVMLDSKTQAIHTYSLNLRLCIERLICAGDVDLNPVAGLDRPELRGDPGDNGLILMGDIWLTGERSLWEVMNDMVEPLSLGAIKESELRIDSNCKLSNQLESNWVIYHPCIYTRVKKPVVCVYTCTCTGFDLSGGLLAKCQLKRRRTSWNTSSNGPAGQLKKSARVWIYT